MTSTVQTVSQDFSTAVNQGVNIGQSILNTFRNVANDLKYGAQRTNQAASPTFQTSQNALFYVGLLVLVLVAVKE